MYQGHAAWCFVTVPKKTSAIIKKTFNPKRKGWGSIRVTVTVRKTSWDTSIFPDSKSGSYVLPLKMAIRKKEQIFTNRPLAFQLHIR
jgi:hypothetical protein